MRKSKGGLTKQLLITLLEGRPEADGRAHFRKTAARCWALLLARRIEGDLGM
ncbi:MAG: hypothetical protein GY702_18730 [Desulfobulbaceae bacterium]|nr:hypothetical protein [Desulfobulbaceae bacterium]